jgi:hypothetical protein
VRPLRRYAGECDATPLSLHAAAPNETRTEAPFALNYSIFVDTKGAGEREAVSNAVASSSEEIATCALWLLPFSEICATVYEGKW